MVEEKGGDKVEREGGGGGGGGGGGMERATKRATKRGRERDGMGRGQGQERGVWGMGWRERGTGIGGREGGMQITSCDPCKFRHTVSTHTCTMIPFELYSLRRASEKWDSNLCRRAER